MTRYKVAIFLSVLGLFILLAKSIVWILGLLFLFTAGIFFLIAKIKGKNKIASVLILASLFLVFFLCGLYLRGNFPVETVYLSSTSSTDVIRLIYNMDFGKKPKNDQIWSIINVDTTNIAIIKGGRRPFTVTKYYLEDSDQWMELKEIMSANDFDGSIAFTT